MAEYQNTTTATLIAALIPLALRAIGTETHQTVNARDLHALSN
jgi:hypothetical protein